MPKEVPINPDINMATLATSNETRAPCMTRLSTSRPMSSVPNQCCADGSAKRFVMSPFSGS